MASRNIYLSCGKVFLLMEGGRQTNECGYSLPDENGNASRTLHEESRMWFQELLFSKNVCP